MPNAQVSPALGRVVVAVVLGVGGYMVWTGVDSFKRHPLATADSVRGELLAIAIPPGVTVTQDLKVIDRGTFIYAQKYFLASEVPSDITARGPLLKRRRHQKLGAREVSRTSMYKGFYFGMVGGLAALSIWIVLRFHLPAVGVLVLAIGLLLPGRILGFFWRDLLRGLRLLNERNFAESRRHSELFLAHLKQRPWLKSLIWLGSSTYSRDPEALALNNLGAAELMLGELDAARKHLNDSIAVDGQNPLPFFNMGNLYVALDDQESAASWFSKAVALGYSKSIVDRIVMSSQKRFAESDGQGIS